PAGRDHPGPGHPRRQSPAAHRGAVEGDRRRLPRGTPGGLGILRRGQMKDLSVISTDRAPKAIGPYSQAVRANGFIFLSGQVPLDPETGELVRGTIEEEAARVRRNIGAVLE